MPLRAKAGGASEVSVEAATVKDALAALATHHPGLKGTLVEKSGEPAPGLVLFVNQVDIRSASGIKTKLRDGDLMRIVPRVSGAVTLPVLQNGRLSAEEISRYARQTVLREVGVDGQLRLKASRIAVVGLGGLGSPVAQYLAAAGVGTVGLIEPDKVEPSNLQRQVLYSTDEVGRPKVQAAAQHVRALNPNVDVRVHPVRIDRHNAMQILGDYDVVVDATDNFPTRYLLNDACAFLGKPLVYASVHRFEGQASVFDAKTGPCYRCLVPSPPPAHLVPNCAEAGVLGALVGIMGSIQATEALKLVLGIGEPLIGRVLLLDALDMTPMTIKLNKSPDCPVCGPTPTITQFIDYDQFCGVPMNPEEKSIRVQDLQRKIAAKEDFLLLDVREVEEHEIANIPQALLIPGSQLGPRLGELEPYKSKEIIVMCHHGSRSNVAANYLRKNGWPRAKNLLGGINAWSEEIDASVPQY
jgi:adenylyltransferase/sulfurtransferase